MKINFRLIIFLSIILFALNFGLLSAATIQDPQGQLVHHLFNIYGAPSAKQVAFSPDGKELWATLLLNKKRGVTIFDAVTGKKYKT